MRATLSKDPFVNIATKFLQTLFADFRHSDFAVKLWDGTIWGDSIRPRFTLILTSPSALRRVFSATTELALGEAFINGDLDVEGDLEHAFHLGDFLLESSHHLIDKLQLGSLFARLPASSLSIFQHNDAQLDGALHSKARDNRAVTYHYDLSNAFYSLWLDPLMVYSCAYFKSRHVGLEGAQKQKLDYICKKLRLKKGERVLDIGCGWGGLMLYAAQHYGVHAFGITLSVPQAEFARERFRTAGVADRCKVEVCDYRDLEHFQPYDKIVSVGMFEHVGEALMFQYFRRAWEMLIPGGVFLNHGIAASATFQRRGPSFIDKYVFPDGEIIPIGSTVRAAESAGFELRDVESLREHYAMTLRQWVQRLEAKAEAAKRIIGDTNYRIWRLYMAGSAHGFVKGRMNLYQLLLSKPKNGGAYLPLTREDWYSIT